MSSLSKTCTFSKCVNGKRTLQRLRREAGFRSAKEFAERIGIPTSTYARYERAGDGAECGIPLPSAWQIADALGCSIDLVVGRADIDAHDDNPIQTRFNALTREGRSFVESYLAFVETSEREGRR